MSGTSLDGLDMALCAFTEAQGRVHYIIEKAQTIEYPDAWRNELRRLHECSAPELARWNAQLGAWMGDRVAAFHADVDLPRAVASHGHTVHHRPLEGYTVQIGHGAALAVHCALPVVCDFRSTDVALGGQGAPLVPIGDALLFSEYPICLNLGGISNASFDHEGKRIAFDISLCNILLNHLAERAGCAYDKGGAMSAQGQIIPSLLDIWDALPFFNASPPKSLGREFFDAHFLPTLHETYSVHDLLRTSVEHIARQWAKATAALPQGNVLVTGGGAFNQFLTERMQALSAHTLVIPDAQTVSFKEALVFAFLGWLRWKGEANALASVTGASRNSVGGAVYLP